MQTGSTTLSPSEDLKNKLPHGDLLSVIQEFLGLLTEFQHHPSFYNLPVLERLLHFLTNVKTPLTLLHTTLEREKLIHNDLQRQIKGMIP